MYPFSLSLFPLLLLLMFIFSFLSIPFVSTNQHANNKNLPQPITNMESHELETLFKIMESMSSDQNWRISYPNPCKQSSSWLGIECKKSNIDNMFHVTRLDFGTHPNPTCKNTATFPSQIFQLPNLESVFFIQCFAYSKTRISFPEKRILGLSLQQLSLRSNPSLIGSIPPQISLLKSLQILTLSQNNLVGQIPLEIFSLSSLVHLDLSYNKLTSKIPYQIGNLKNLVGLDLSYNNFIGPIPNTIGQLGTLQKLDLSSNSFTGKIPESIENLHSLIFLALSNNKLSGKFPKGLPKLQSLQYFLMDDNPMFIQLPIEFAQLKKLQELRLASSGYSGKIPSSYSQLLNLRTLSLQNNRLTGEIPVEFSSFSHMYHLNLSRNFLDGVVPFNSSFLKRLGRNLDLSGNPGLCFNPPEANGVYLGVNICGRNNTSSITMPLKKSEASYGVMKSFFLMFVLCTMALYHLVFFV
ncbi:receptor like protein 29-like [Nicotiana tomentosiformis]|uniref:Protein TOO MANY MOUTHS-like n=1 Tax=Nicotiana tabacum TaxID=4097 RepID=A0A1S4D0N7_TOBAC|nr:receptor like protein 29-like [Nicotiana tomentosiformis]XP_016506951.1 PREDICTED: protein TOO MANY MOUTHS-like [Nicotiana tabacum]